MDDKNEIRKNMLSRREAMLPEEYKHASQTIRSRIKKLGKQYYKNYVAAYFPTRNEPDILGEHGFGASVVGRRFLPVVVNNNILKFREWDVCDTLPLHPNRFGIPEPVEGRYLDDPELAPVSTQDSPLIILIPCVAFDRRGYRIGYGGGYYDRALAHLRETHAVIAIGVAFGFQEVARLSNEPFDQRLDAIITESETISVV